MAANSTSSIITNQHLFDCDLCKVKCGDKSSYDAHLAGKKHQLLHQNYMREIKKANCGVYVTGFSPDTPQEELIAFFSKFGLIESNFFGNNNKFLIIQFADANIPKQLVERTIPFKNDKLFCKNRIVKPKLPNFHKEENHIISENNILDNEAIVDQLKKFNNFELQMFELFRLIEAPLNEMLPKYHILFNNLTIELSKEFPQCRPCAFGSSVTGLAFKNSDLDVFVEVPNIPENLPEPYPIFFIKKARKALRKYRTFNEVIAITRAKTPIIKCIHNPTRISCDINFKSSLGVCNSSLIKYFLSVNTKLRPLMMLLKYWARVNDLVGHGRFTNYALIMMGIFYLQQHPNPILPSVFDLQTPECENLQEEWNAGFSTNPQLLPNCFIGKSVADLLEGFFNFYANFDYALKVICPYTGTAIDKIDFKNPERLPIEFNRYVKVISENVTENSPKPLKVDGPVNVQDPFEQTHNLSGAVPQRILEEFIASCRLCIDIFKSSTDNNLLIRLLTEQPETENKFEVNNTQAKFKFRFPGPIEYLQKNVPIDVDDRDHKIRLEWFKCVSEFMTMILINVFYFKIDIVPPQNSSGNKSQKLEGQQDIHDNDIVDSVLFHCIGNQNLWEARKKISKNITFKDADSLIKREIEVSSYIIDTVLKNIRLNDKIVEFRLGLNARVNPTEVEVRLTEINSNKGMFKTMATFFCRKVPMWFEKHIKDLNRKTINVDDAKQNSANVNKVSQEQEIDNFNSEKAQS